MDDSREYDRQSREHYRGLWSVSNVSSQSRAEKQKNKKTKKKTCCSLTASHRREMETKAVTLSALSCSSSGSGGLTRSTSIFSVMERHKRTHCSLTMLSNLLLVAQPTLH